MLDKGNEAERVLLEVCRSLVESARFARQRPRVHGNGFIQLDVAENRRVHFWGHPDIPRQKVCTPIHNHVFSFVSTCVKGQITNIPYVLIPSWNDFVGDDAPTYRLWEAVPREGDDTLLELVDDCPVMSALPVEADVIGPRESYVFPSFEFHETVVSVPTITIIIKGGKTLGQNPEGPRPRVAVPFGMEPDNEFNRHAFEEKKLWQIIDEMLEQ